VYCLHIGHLIFPCPFIPSSTIFSWQLRCILALQVWHQYSSYLKSSIGSKQITQWSYFCFPTLAISIFHYPGWTFFLLIVEGFFSILIETSSTKFRGSWILLSASLISCRDLSLYPGCFLLMCFLREFCRPYHEHDANGHPTICFSFLRLRWDFRCCI
jgi:hypothetical protein